MHLCSVVCESPAAMMRSLRVWLSVSVYRTLYDPFCPFIIYPWLLVFAFTRGCWYLPLLSDKSLVVLLKQRHILLFPNAYCAGSPTYTGQI
jgi:hypothetical protein